MNFIEIFLIGVALAMDAFAVSITCGLKLQQGYFHKVLKFSLSFGLFQAAMPTLGYFFGSFVKVYVETYAPWIVFFIFLVLALKTIKEIFSHTEENSGKCQCINNYCLGTLSLATSIDALLIGLVLALKGASIVLAASTIGIVTFVICVAGGIIGHHFHAMMGKKAGFVAAGILLLLAFKAILG